MREGLDETLTVIGLGLSDRLQRSLATTNAIESLLSRTRHVKQNVKWRRGGTMVLRWVAAGVLEAAKSFRRVKGKAPPVFLDTDLGENPMSKEVGKMVRSRDVVQAEGSARTEGARRATGVRADGAAAGAGSLAPGQRWSASRKRDVVLRLLRGESLEALSREAGVEIYRLDAWRERAMAGLELGLKDRHGEPVAEVLDAAKRHIGELSMEIELLRERARAAEQRLPLAMRRSRR